MNIGAQGFIYFLDFSFFLLFFAFFKSIKGNFNKQKVHMRT